MGFARIFLSLASVLFAFSFPIYGLCSSFCFIPGGDCNSGELSCELPLKSIGNLSFRDGVALIDGRKIIVKGAMEYYDSPHILLKGNILRAEADVALRKCTITGLAVFLSGDGLSKLSQAEADDIIFTHHGAVYGKLMDVSAQQIQLLKNDGSIEQIDLSSVVLVRSPRACLFTITGTTAQPIPAVTPFSAELESVVFKTTSTERMIPAASVIPLSERSLVNDGDDGLSGCDDAGAVPNINEEEPISPFRRR